MGETPLEIEGDRSRSEVAATLRALAEQLDRGEEVQLVESGTTVALVPADDLGYELEVERESDGDADAEIELEIELSWAEPSEPPAAETADEEPEQPGDEDVPASTAAEPDEAAAGDVDPAVPDDADSLASLAHFEVFEDRAGEWRWRLVHRNGNIIATSGEGYTTRQNAEKGMRSVMRNASGASVRRE